MTPIREDLGLKEKRLAFETTAPRPGHADLPGAIKWNHHDMRNVLERASARETGARVLAGAVCAQLLERREGTVRVLDIGCEGIAYRDSNGWWQSRSALWRSGQRRPVTFNSLNLTGSGKNCLTRFGVQ